MESGNGSHGCDQQRAQARSLVAGIHLCRQGRQRGWRSRLRDGPDAQCVDARGRSLSVPSQRNGMARPRATTRPLRSSMKSTWRLAWAGTSAPK